MALEFSDVTAYVATAEDAFEYVGYVRFVGNCCEVSMHCTQWRIWHDKPIRIDLPHSFAPHFVVIKTPCKAIVHAYDIFHLSHALMIRQCGLPIERTDLLNMLNFSLQVQFCVSECACLMCHPVAFVFHSHEWMIWWLMPPLRCATKLLENIGQLRRWWWCNASDMRCSNRSARQKQTNWKDKGIDDAEEVAKVTGHAPAITLNELKSIHAHTDNSEMCHKKRWRNERKTSLAGGQIQYV